MEFPRLKSSKEEGFGHPSSKPVPLIACEQLGRICYRIELDPKFVDVAVKRFVQAVNGAVDDVYVMRGGQKLTLDEALQEVRSDE